MTDENARARPLMKIIPSCLFALSCAAVPLLGNDLPGYTWAVLGVALAFLLLALARRPSGAGSPSAIALQDVGAIAFFVCSVLSLGYSVHIRATENSLLWLAVCLGCYITARAHSSGLALHAVAKVLVWAACLTVLIQILRLLTLGNSGYPYIFSGFYNKNIYGGFLASTLPLVFLGKKTGNNADSTLRAVYGGIILAGLVLTFSRAAWLVAILGLLAITAIYLLRREYRAILALGAAVTIGLCVGFGLDRLTNQRVIGRQVRPGYLPVVVTRSIAPRIAYWRNALSIGASAPLLGKGYGTFADTHMRVMRWPVYSKYAHNHFLQVFTELGASGLALFLLTLGASGLAWLRRRNRMGPDDATRWPFYLAALLVLAHACFDFTLETPEGALWFWLLLGLGCPVFLCVKAGATGIGWRQKTLAGIGIMLLLCAGVLHYRQGSAARLTQAALASKEPGETTGLLSRALRVRPYDDELLMHRANANRQAGRLEQARSDCLSAIGANPFKPGYRLRLAFILVQLGRKEEARSEAERALAFNPTLPDIVEGYGLLMLVAERPQKGTVALAWSILLQGAKAGGISLEFKRTVLAGRDRLAGERGDIIRVALAKLEFEAGNHARSQELLARVKETSGQARYVYNQLTACLGAEGLSRPAQPGE